MMCHLLNLDDGTLHCTILKSRMCITVSHWLNSMSDLTNDINPNICFYSNKLLQSQTTHYNHTIQLVVEIIN